MSDFIKLPSFLVNNIDTSSNMSAMVYAPLGCPDCEVVCTGCMGSGCEASCTSGCTSSCTSSCTSYECDDCQVVCMSCLGSCETGEGLPKLPTPTLNTAATVKTANSIEITINYMEEAYRYHARINGANEQTSTSRTFTFTGLTPNTQYYIEIKVGGVGYEDSDWAGYYATTLAAELWEWWTPKETDNLKLSPDEWLAFCNKINEVRISKGLLSYPFTTNPVYIADGKLFPVWVFLQAANAINEMGGIAPQLLTVKSMDESPWGNDSIIYPWYFDNLKTALNNAIDS